MGFKRPFDNEESQELPFKHSRQLDFSNKLIQFGEVVPRHDISEKASFTVESQNAFCKYQGEGRTEEETLDEDSHYVDLDFGTNIPFTWVGKISNGDDASGTTLSSLSQEYFGLDLPRRTFNSFEDGNLLLLDLSPIKQVPVGPDHQADIPIWVGDRKADKPDESNASLHNHAFEEEDKDKLMGTCIIPMPENCLSAQDNTGEERKDCVCLDRGSVRCVRQHVKEARDSLLITLGHDRFVGLGFPEMGEEVALKWSEEEEQLFHEVVYSNPVSQGRNFWKHLEVEFPCRSKKEIVSYYFNVFILRRRAIQNKSCLLDIDSDDDEWHGSYGGSAGDQLSEDGEDSAIESPVNEDLEMDHGRVYSHHKEDDWDDHEYNENDGDDCCNADVKSGEELKVEDDSCTSFELQQNISRSPDHTDNERQTCREKKPDSEVFKQRKLPESQTYLFEPSDVKVWGARFSAVQAKNTDLLSTRSIIEEIFGQGTWDNRDKK